MSTSNNKNNPNTNKTNSKTNQNKSTDQNTSSNEPIKYLEYYVDREGTQTLPLDDITQKPIIKFGAVEQGHSVKTTIYVKNMIDYDIALEPIFDPPSGDPDLKITRYPAFIQPGSIQPVTIVFACDPDRAKPLKTKWDFKKTILARQP